MIKTLHSRLNTTPKRLAEFCRRNRIRDLAVFGSALRDDFADTSDLDFLVSFLPEARVGFLALSRMQRELQEIVGRPVDLVPKRGLKPAIRDQVLDSAQRVYAA